MDPTPVTRRHPLQSVLGVADELLLEVGQVQSIGIQLREPVKGAVEVTGHEDRRANLSSYL